MKRSTPRIVEVGSQRSSSRKRGSFLVSFLILALTLPSLAFALRTTGLEESPQERKRVASALLGGRREPLRSQRPVAVGGILPRGEVSIPTAQAAAGLEEAWEKKLDNMGSVSDALRDKNVGGFGESDPDIIRALLKTLKITERILQRAPERDRKGFLTNFRQGWRDFVYLLTDERRSVGQLQEWLSQRTGDAQLNRKMLRRHVVTMAVMHRFGKAPPPTSTTDFLLALETYSSPAVVSGSLSTQGQTLAVEEQQPLLAGTVRQVAEVIGYPHKIVTASNEVVYSPAAGAEEKGQAIKEAVLKSARSLVNVKKDSAFLSHLEEDGENARFARLSLMENRLTLQRSDKVLEELLRDSFGSPEEALPVVQGVELPPDLEEYRPQIQQHFKEVIDGAFSTGGLEEGGAVTQKRVRGFLGALGKEAPEGITPVVFSPAIRELYPVVNALSGLEEQNVFLLEDNRDHLSRILARQISERDIRRIVYAGLEEEVEAARPITRLAGVDLRAVVPGQGRDFLNLMVAALAQAAGLEEAAIQARDDFQGFQAGLEQLAAIGV